MTLNYSSTVTVDNTQIGLYEQWIFCDLRIFRRQESMLLLLLSSYYKIFLIKISHTFDVLAKMILSITGRPNRFGA